MKPRPLVKICGVTRPEDAVAAADLGADLLGLNFYPPSPRCLEVARAVEIADAVRGRLPLVGVFVHRPAAEVAEIDRAVGLDLLQFHGDEEPAEVAAWGARAIRVFRRRQPPDAAELGETPDVWGFLFDVPHEALYGGTGESWDYGAVAGVATAKPVLLAGGVHPGNVRRALSTSGAAGVDVCSGVESAPGIKDVRLMSRLLAEVRDG